MQIEKITWKTHTPAKFPCFICHQNRAEWRGQFRHEGITVNLCLCNLCACLPESELIAHIFKE